MPVSSVNQNPDGDSFDSLVQQSVAQAGLKLTPEQMRALAEKLYAMLRDDVRMTRARRQEPLPRR